LYDINWDIASKKHGIIRSNSIALDHYIKIPQGSIVEIYSMYEQNSGDFGIGYNIDLPLFIKHYHFNNNKPIEVNSLKELDKLKNSISFLNIETLSSEDINNYIKLSKKNNNTLFLYHTKKIKIFSTEIKEFKTDIELKLSPVYRYYPNYKKEQFRQTYLKINQIINKNEYDFAEIPYSKEGINYYKEYLDLSIIKTNQIKVEINNKIIYYFYNGKSNLKLKQKISNKFYLSKGDLISDNIYDVLNLIKKDNIIKKQLKKEISTKIDSLDKNNYKFINCNKTWRQHFFKISNFRNLLNENESIILIKSFMKNDKKRIYELKEKFHKSGIEKNINSFLLNKLWEKLILLSKYKEEFNNHIPISYYDLFKKKE